MLWAQSPTWVHCPRCEGPARIDGDWGQTHQPRITCTACHYQGRPPAQAAVGAGERTAIRYWNPRCFRCGGQLPKRTDARPRFHRKQAIGRIKCPGCGHATDYPLAIVPRPVSEGVDQFFGLKLFLSVPVGRWTLWAWNLHHIDLLEAWLSASLRERHPTPYYMTMMARLPQWMKRASNRQAVLKGLVRLRAKAAEAGIA